MTLGDEGKEQSRVFSPTEASEILDIFASHGHDELDTARMYGEGSSERMLARIGAEKAGFKIVRAASLSASGTAASQLTTACSTHFPVSSRLRTTRPPVTPRCPSAPIRIARRTSPELST
jgi:hypothetical protein